MKTTLQQSPLWVQLFAALFATASIVSLMVTLFIYQMVPIQFGEQVQALEISRAYTVQMLYITIGALFLLATLFTGWLYWLIIRPLNRLNRKLDGLGLEIQTEQLASLKQPTVSSELSTLANSIDSLRATVLRRKQREDELEAARDKLAILNANLRNELKGRERTETSLTSERDEALQISKLKSKFVSTMSHELRTPLNVILLTSDILLKKIRGPLTEKQCHSLRNIEESGQRLLSIIEDILDLSKIDAGDLNLEPEKIALKPICEASLRFIKRETLKKRIHVDVSLDPAVQTVKADEARLKQILVSLLTNAVKFTPDNGQVGLEVIGNATEKQVAFTIWDTGIGIPPRDIGRIFEPFVQLDNRLVREHEGAGLGLSMVKHIVELHEGKISVESQEGKGSRFTLTLPWEAPAMITKPTAAQNMTKLKQAIPQLNLELAVQ